jgi:ATP-dependent helicase/nuclease subunit A
VLDVLASPGHDLSLARALKSPLFGARTTSCWRSRVPRCQAPAAAGGRRCCGPAPPGAVRWRARPPCCGAGPRRRPALPPHDLLDRIVHEGELLPRLAAAVPAPRRARRCRRCMRCWRGGGAGRRALPTPYGFVRALRCARCASTPAPPADAVQLLTVHGAKGLEARAVFIVDADPELRNPARATLLVDWPVQELAPRVAAFVHSEAAVAPSLAPLLDSERVEREREEINALYVAMTRSRERLVFSATVPHRPQVGPSWWRRVQGVALAVDVAAVAAASAHVEAQVQAQAQAQAESEAQAEAAVDSVPAPEPRPGVLPMPTGLGAPAPTVHSPDSAPVILDTPLIWQGAPAETTAPAPLEGGAPIATASLGQALHRALEWLGRPGAAVPRAEWPALADAAAAAFGLAPVHAAELLAALTRVLDSPAAARFFGGSALEWAGNEVPLALDGELLRIDRLVALRDGGRRCWWVLDYKLAGAPEVAPALRAQLARYVAAVQAAQPGEPVRAAFVTARGEVREL